ncbi:CLUMA_CG009586, isoform A [Clunio marinus]|uniref:CLUMA_CG009586, isoform A n=1 Tax=Clunio marinus TaxID=568069 RepID=A0A1J1I7A2_9DIPT|nr:CLUMA_CG009586, isoform A [Clunio marinus]
MSCNISSFSTCFREEAEENRNYCTSEERKPETFAQKWPIMISILLKSVWKAVIIVDWSLMSIRKAEDYSK